MDPLAVLARLARSAPRAAASDAERRASTWLRDDLRSRGREASLESVWVRPRWELAAALGVALALAGSVTSVWESGVGLGLLALALVGLAGEVSGRLLLLRRVLPERATQNLVSPPRPPTAVGDQRLRLIITANVDAGRCGAISADRWTGLESRLRRLASGHLSTPLAALVADVAALVALAALRVAGFGGVAVSTVQFVLTVALVVALVVLLDIALADVSPGANVNGSGVGVALALADALDAARLRRLEVWLLLAGAGDHSALGMRAFVAARRRRWRAEDTIVLAIGPCGIGTPRWLDRDGALFGPRLHPRLRATMAEVADRERHLRAAPIRGRGSSGAYPARLAGWPAIAVGSFDDLDRVPRAHRPDDIAEAIEPAALEAMVELCVAFVERIDAGLAADARAAAPASA